MPFSHCFDQCSLVVGFDNRKYESSNSVLPFQDCLGYSRSLEIPYEFQDGVFYFHKVIIGILIGIALNLQIALGSIDILTILILPVHEYGMSLCLFLSFSNISQFTVSKSLTSLVRFILKYFILFDAIINGIMECFLNFPFELFIASA